MIITQPPDAKLPEHLHSYPSDSHLRFSSSADGHPIPFDSQSQSLIHRAPSIADSELPPAYTEPPLPPPIPVSRDPATFKRRLRRRRKFRILACAVLGIYIASTSILLVLFWTGHLTHKQFDFDGGNPIPHYGLFAPVYPAGYLPPGASASDGHAVTCNAWASSTSTPSSSSTAKSNSTSSKYSTISPEYTSYLRYQLSPNNTLNVVKLFLHAGSGAASSGTLTVTTDDSIAAPLVDVTMRYRDFSAKNFTEVCLMRTADQVGLGIYTSNAPAVDHPAFDLALHLPAGTIVEELITDLSYFTQTIGRPKEKFATDLGTLELQGTFSPLYIMGVDVHVQNAKAQTSFSTIWGQFQTSESLILQTSQAAINVNVTLVRLSDNSAPVALSLITENAIVQSTVTVSTSANNTSADKSVSDFTIQASTANAPVSLVVQHAKGSSVAKIDIEAVSSYAPVVVSLDPMFEGTFDITSGVGAELKKDPDVSDPLYLGRQRHFVIAEQNPYSVQGSVDWEPSTPSTRLGAANLTTQHAKAVLYLEKSCSESVCPGLSALSMDGG